MLTRRLFAKSLASLALASGSAWTPAFAKTAILTLSGRSNGASITVPLDLADIDALPQTSFRTTTPWTEGVVEFSGVLLQDCLAASGITGDKLHLVALNDYEAEADRTDMANAEALLATRQNGRVMTIADKGPVFLMFPFDRRSDLQRRSYYAQAVWQLAEVNIE
ncbi:hypothetical protein [Aureimonas sp. AU20]|uniref:hypothetical protein n=1 Tax=Aureimonas sp. AU20 TaxID=1349819 RepID=UPI0007214F70|nr:hypothetical protein [Aureimonas sp. AU20]ALN74988.1 hypothetical protein M673_19870 [Aureimonas sp. AU20]